MQELRNKLIKIIKTPPFIILIIFFFINILFLYLENKANLVLIWDENAYISNARYLLGYSHYNEIFRFPLISWIIASIWALFGENWIIAKLVLIIMHCIAIYIFYNIIYYYLKDHFYAISATSLYALSGLTIFWSYRIYPDLLATDFLILTVYSFFVKNKHILSGIFASLSFLAKFTYGIIYIFPFSYLIFSKFSKNNLKDKLKDIFLFYIGVSIVIIPWLIWNLIYFKNPIWNLYEQYIVVKQWAYIEPIQKLILNIIKILGPFAILGYPILGFFIKENKKLFIFYINIGVYLILALLVLSWSKMKLSRYILLFYPLWVFLYIINIFYLEKKILKIEYILLFPLVISSFISSWYTYSNTLKWRFLCFNTNSSIYKSLEILKIYNISSQSTILSNCYWTWTASYYNTYSYYLFNNNTYIVSKNPDFIIYCPKYSKIDLSNFKNYKLILNYTDNCNNIVLVYSKIK